MIEITPFQKTIDKLKAEGKYRVFNDILRERGQFPNAIWYVLTILKTLLIGVQMII